MRTKRGLARRSSPDGPPSPSGSSAPAWRLRFRRRSASASEGGFTLVEVLVALVVAVAAMTLVAQGLSTGARASTSSQFATRAVLLAQRVVTDLETGQLSLSSSQSGTFEDDSDFAFETASQTGDVTGLTQVKVTVKWKERNQDRTYVLTRLMRERPTATSSSSSSTTTPR